MPVHGAPDGRDAGAEGAADEMPVRTAPADAPPAHGTSADAMPEWTAHHFTAPEVMPRMSWREKIR